MMLLQARADVCRKTKNGKTALELAKEYDNQEMTQVAPDFHFYAFVDSQ